jgi:hypothetical protein
MTPNYRPLTPPPSGIIFHEVHRWQFSEPEALIAYSPLSALYGLGLGTREGVYAILVDDSTARPRPFRAVYFGEAEDVRSRATATHENHSAWQREAGTYGRLYRAFHPMPGSTQTQRQVVESALIAAYNTPCNQKLSFDFARLIGGK